MWIDWEGIFVGIIFATIFGILLGATILCFYLDKKEEID